MNCSQRRNVLSRQMLQLDALAKVPKYGLVVFTETYGAASIVEN
jgi:hypothetical protein